jgi:hypothetical protein
MWRNTEVAGWLDWLRARNASVVPEARVGFFGLDIYSLRESMDAVVRYLEREDPEAAERARILATPTLVRSAPLPELRVTGDLSDPERVLIALELADAAPHRDY